MSPRLAELQEYLQREIPLTRIMELRVVPLAGNDDFSLEAPVRANSNHLQTAFGGSINAVATLAGYAYLWLRQPKNRNTHVVVAESRIRFRRPIHQTVRAVCEPAIGELKSSRQRLRVNVYDGESSAVAALFEGEFVIKKS